IKVNLEKFNLKGEIIRSDMFNSVKGEFDLIISNPPYIKRDEYKNLPIDVKIEPSEALIGGEDGLFYIKILISEGPNFLKENGLLVIEIEKDELEEIKNFLDYLKIREIIKTSSDNIIGVVLEKL
ncbi:MAG: methyltransferase, partial [Caldisericia bacterium]|nr:methyltransferase [Caldisericia bacterium]